MELEGGVHQRAKISFIGSLGSSGPKVLEGSFPPGSTRVINVQSADGKFKGSTSRREAMPVTGAVLSGLSGGSSSGE